MKILILLLTFLITITLSQQSVNRVVIRGGLDSSFGCWLTVSNDQQMLDLRTTCPIGNNSERIGLSKMIQFIPEKKAYYFKELGEEVRGYRYIKDSLNYFYKFYNFETYHSIIP